MFCKWCGAKVGDAAACPACGEALESPRTRTPLSRLLFMRTVLEALSRGSVLRSLVTLVWRVSAALLAVFGLAAWTALWKSVASFDGAGFLAGVVFQLLFALGLYMVVHAQLIRADDVDGLPDSEFTVMPILSVLLRLAGEQQAIVAGLLGVGGFALLAFAGPVDGLVPVGLPVLGDLVRSGSGWTAGALFLATSWALALGGLFAAYFLAEALIVLVRIASSTSVIKDVALQHERRRARE